MEEKVYGEYPGFLSKEGIDIVSNGNELDLYMTINSIGHFIWRMNHDMADGRIELKPGLVHDLLEAQYAIEFAVTNTNRFGIDITKGTETEHVKPSDNYYTWLRAWDDYIQYELNEDEYNKLMDLIKNNGDYSMYRPKELEQHETKSTDNIKINEDNDGTFTL
jgi:hypothetical protein